MVTVRSGSCDGERRLTEALAAGLPGSVLENGGDTPLAEGVVPRLRLVVGKSPKKQRRSSMRVVARGGSCREKWCCFEWRKTIFGMVTIMEICHAKPYTLRGGPSTKLEHRLLKAWKLSNHP
ncbi:hypothetical protein Tco_0812416 [Tanacetum coccineum]